MYWKPTDFGKSWSILPIRQKTNQYDGFYYWYLSNPQSTWSTIPFLVAYTKQVPVPRVLPKIVGCSVAIVTFFYMLTVISYHSVLDMNTMNTAQVAVASVSHTFFLPFKFSLPIWNWWMMHPSTGRIHSGSFFVWLLKLPMFITVINKSLNYLSRKLQSSTWEKVE